MQAGNVQAYPWNDQQLRILHSHKDYHRQMLHAIRDLERNGPQGQVLPQMPQTNLSSLLPSLRTEPTEPNWSKITRIPCATLKDL